MRAPATSLYLLSVGARTPLGLGAARSAAAVRAGISCATEVVLSKDRPWTMRQAAFDPGLDRTLAGPGRFVALAEDACRDACVPFERLTRVPQAVPCFLALPQPRPGLTATDLIAIESGLAGLDLPVAIRVKAVADGHAAGLLALAEAARAMYEGSFEMCLVGGIDSYAHPETMLWLDENGRLAGGDARSAFVPGEGAAFCLVATEAALRRVGVEPLMRVNGVATSHELALDRTDSVVLGTGLTTAIRAAVERLTTDRLIHNVICDLNGERHRGEEWGFVCLRLATLFEDSTDYVSPADCWGDMGAASAPLFIMLACESSRRRFSKGPRTMIWASSDGGLRGAAVLESVDNA